MSKVTVSHLGQEVEHFLVVALEGLEADLEVIADALARPPFLDGKTHKLAMAWAQVVDDLAELGACQHTQRAVEAQECQAGLRLATRYGREKFLDQASCIEPLARRRAKIAMAGRGSGLIGSEVDVRLGAARLAGGKVIRRAVGVVVWPLAQAGCA